MLEEASKERSRATGLHRARLRLLGGVMAGIGMAALPGVAAAQTAPDAAAQPAAIPPQAEILPDDTPADDIVVTGIRGAIIQGLESKRRSDVIVESIKSEEIGKFPDKNLAEALQRVPGLSIDRDGGEGRFVSIRGLGPGFNTVLLNGRRIASENYNRSFSFDTISSDLIGGVNVYKTQQSYIREGGVGGTVDVRTARPLDRPGTHGAFRLEGLYEENSGKLTPNGSALFSTTFLDNRVGILMSFARQERRNRTYTTGTGSLRTIGAFTASDPVAYPALFAYDNFGVSPVYRPQEFNRNRIDEHRVRTGYSAAVQLRPVDGLEVNLDYLRSDFNTDTTVNSVSNWLYAVNPPKSAAGAVAGNGAGFTGFADYIRNQSRTEVDENGVVVKMDTNPNAGSQAFNVELNRRPTRTQMAGANIAYDIDDSLQLKLDGAYSTAKLDNPGLNRRRSMEIVGVGKYFLDATGAVPAITDIDPRLNASYDNASLVQVRQQYNTGDLIDAKNYEFSGELNWKINPDFKVRVGALRETGEKSLDRYATADALQQQVYQNSGYTFRSAAELRSVTNGILSPDPSLFGQAAGANNDTFLINVDAYDRYMADPANLARLRQIIAGRADATQRLAAIDAFIANGSSYAAVRTGASSRVKETVTSAYFDADGDFRLFGMESHITAGVRYTRTDITASGFSRVLTGFRKPIPAPNGPPPDPLALEGIFAAADGPGGLTELALRSKYENFLPSMNLKVLVTDDLVFRFAASQTLTRPELDEVAPRFNFGALSEVGSFASTNNTDLRPLVSTNLDASLEWYPAAATSFAVDLYQKQIDGLIVSGTTSGLTVPTVPAGPFNNFTISRPVNGGDVRLRGATFSVTHSFAFGAGIQANYTMVGSNRPFDPDSYDATKTTLPGVSDSFNVIGFYERGPIAARVAYNRRGGFLRNPSFCGGIYCSEQEPVFAKSYEQLDARLGFNVLKNVQVYAEGINLTKSSLAQSGRYDNLFVSFENFGRRFTFGVSARF